MKELYSNNKKQTIDGGDVMVDDLVVPHHVIIELKKNNLSVHNFTRGELEDIIQACADGKLKENPEEGTLRHQMVKKHKHTKSWVDRCCPEGHRCEEMQHQGHAEIITEERKKNKWGHPAPATC
jgi:hypothetical protein